MNRFFYISILVFAATKVSAQQADTVKHDKQIAQDTLNLPIGKIDSITLKAKLKTDSVSQRLQKIQGFQLPTPKFHKADSAKQAAMGMLNKPVAVEKQLASSLNKVNPNQEVVQYNQKVQVLRKHFQHHLDSLGKLQVKDPRVTKSMDSLQKKLNKLKNAKSIKDVKKGEAQLAKLQSGLNTKVKGLEGKVNKELAEVNKLGGSNLKIPDTNIPNLNLPGVNTKIPGIGSANLNTSLPNASIPGISTPNALGNGAGLPGSPSNVPGLNTSTSGLTGNILPTGELQNLEKEASQLTKATGEISKAEGDIKNMNTDKLSKDLEKDAGNIKEVKGLQTEALQVEQYKKMVAKWESDPEYRKELAVTKAKEQAINHFAGQEKQLMAAMQQLTNVKTKYKDYEGALDMFKKPTNPMKGKPFIERLRPGFNLQFQFKKNTWLDFNPQVGYRFTGRLMAGLGWNERWSYDFNKWEYVSQDHIYGPRAFAQVKIKSGIYAMLAPEVMNALVPPSYSSTDPGTRKWVWSWMAGMKKEFRYSKNMLGSLQVLYNLFDKHNQSPYVSKLNIRMGFEFPMKKK